MKLVRADADFRPEAELVAVVEARAGVDHHGGGIDLGREALGRSKVVLGRGDGEIPSIFIAVAATVALRTQART